jgi:CubicO group peptidase (beta-lactamase class C family)
MSSSRRAFLKHFSLGSLSLCIPSIHAQATPHHLARGTPESAGVSAKAILDFLDAVEHEKMELHSFMMLRHGQVIAEGWWEPYGPELVHTMYSMSKSFTSTAVGFAVAEGKMSVEDKVVSFFPDDLPAKVSDNLAAMRVKDLLTMSTGNEKEPTQSVHEGGELGAHLSGANHRAQAGHAVHVQQRGHLHVLRHRAEGHGEDACWKYLTPRLV